MVNGKKTATLGFGQYFQKCQYVGVLSNVYVCASITPTNVAPRA